MAEGFKSALIAALRGDGDYSGPRSGRGPQALNFDWGSSTGVNFRRRAAGGALNPARLRIPAGPDYKARQPIGSDSSYRDSESPVLAVPTTITPFPQNEPIVTSQPQFIEPDVSNLPLPLPEFSLEQEPKQDVSISYEELVDPNPWNVQAPPAEVVKQEPDVAISYEELVDPNPWNVKAPPAEVVAQKPSPEVAITYEELVDPNPWNINAPPAEITQKQDPEVAVTVEEIPEPEPSTLRETLASLIPSTAVPADMPVPEPEPEATVTVEEVPDAPVPVTQEVAAEPSVPPALRDAIEALIPAVPVTSPVPEPEPEGTVTVEEIPDAPIVSDGRPSGGGYTLDTGLSRELMMLAALADMIGSADPEGQITIEELEDFR